MALTVATTNKLSIALLASGALKTYTGTNQAANTEFTETVPAGVTWLLLGVSAVLNAGITQTPWPSLTITDGTNTVWQAFAGTAAIAAATGNVRCSWAIEATQSGGAADTARTGGLPVNMYLPAGFVVASATAGIGANDDYAAPSFLVIEYS